MLGWTPEEAAGYLNDNYKVASIAFDDKYGMAVDFMIGPRTGAIIIFVSTAAKKEKFYATLTHECIHAANMVFARADLRISTSDDEILAHYAGKLVEEALKFHGECNRKKRSSRKNKRRV